MIPPDAVKSVFWRQVIRRTADLALGPHVVSLAEELHHVQMNAVPGPRKDRVFPPHANKGEEIFGDLGALGNRPVLNEVVDALVVLVGKVLDEVERRVDLLRIKPLGSGLEMVALKQKVESSL